MSHIAEHEEEPGRYVVYAYCISLVVITFKRYSSPVFVKRGESAFIKSLPYTLLTLALGWWGFPFGPIYSVWALYENIKGGKPA